MAIHNYARLTGRLTAQPELKTTQGGISNVRFTVAVNRPYRKDKKAQADFISCVAWRGTAEFICKNFNKGDAIDVSGMIMTGSYEKDGQRHYTVDVAVEQVAFPVGGRSGQNQEPGNEQPPQNQQTNQQQAPQTPYQQPAPNYATAQNTDFEEIIDDDDDLPF